MNSFYFVDFVGTSANYSLISDLEVIQIDGALSVFATTHYDGSLTRWSVGADGLSLTGTFEFEGGLRAGSSGNLTKVYIGDQINILTGGAANGGLQLLGGLDGAGLPTTGVGLGAASAQFAWLQHGQSVTLVDGNQLVIGALAGSDGLASMVLNQSGTVTSTSIASDSDDIFGADIRDVAIAEIGSQTFVLAASSTENGVSVWTPRPDGSLNHEGGIGIDDGLWVAAPTALEVAVVDGQVFVVLAAADSGSLSVMSLDATGQLNVTDHLIDDLHSRFGGVTALNVVEHHGHIYVIAGGADDGISVFMLRSDGTLLARGHLADTTQMGLANVSAISAVSEGNGIDIFVASSQEAGLTHLHFDTGPSGEKYKADDTGQVISGTAGLDILEGGNGDDRLSGGAGDDILSDGAGVDRLVGGAGEDTFVFSYDNTTDLILDYEVGVDQIDLSSWPMLRSLSQIEFGERHDGVMIRYGDDTLIIRSADGQPIDPSVFVFSDLVGNAHIPQNIVPGFPGPAQDIPELPQRPEYTPYVYEPPAGDPNPESTVVVPTSDNVNSTDATWIVRGTSADDRLAAGAGNTVVFGFGGNDRIWGSSAADTLFGGSGADRISGLADDDRIFGGSGSDQLFGNKGNDNIAGGGGRDLIKGHKGADNLYGGGAADRIRGGGGSDTLKGNTGHDRLWGGNGADRLYGGNGNDTLRGGRKDDVLFGGNKRDILIGGAGRDELKGGKGADTLNGAAGSDRLTGGTGADVFVFTDGRDVVTDFKLHADTLQLDDRNWTGTLTARQLVDSYATVQNGNVVIDFGNNDRLTLNDVTNLSRLADSIEII